MKVVSIPVITRLQDGGDGGFTMYAYNNEDDLIKDHPLSRRNGGEISPKLRKEILTENDPHNNGYIGHDIIKVQLNDDGTAQLAESLRMHAGQ